MGGFKRRVIIIAVENDLSSGLEHQGTVDQISYSGLMKDILCEGRLLDTASASWESEAAGDR